jgi:hypothetical protein
MQFVFQREDCSGKEKRTIRALSLDIITAQPYNEIFHLYPGSLAEKRHYAPVGSVEFCLAWMRAVGASIPAPIDYPVCLQKYLHRAIRKTTYSRAAYGSWVKPYHTKAWNPRIKKEELPGIFPDEPVWECDFIKEDDWLAEWRVYIINGDIVGIGRYDPNETEYELNIARVAEMISTYEASGDAPVAYAIDVAKLPELDSVLVEVTDAWAIGFYLGTLSPQNYARLLYSRWKQISQKS